MNNLTDQQAFLVFNHHLGGVFVLFMGSISLLEVLNSARYKRIGFLWPISLLVLGGYMILLSDLTAWPVGPLTLRESLADPMVLQHKTFALILLTLGVIDLLRRLGSLSAPGWQGAFYAIALLPGVMLLAHSAASPGQHHPAMQGVLFSHSLIGFLALVTLAAKVLVDIKVIMGYKAIVYPVLIFMLGLQLFLYTE
jgi:hypothetical protein